MLSSEDVVLSISNLPPDVIRTIIRLGQEAIDIMKQISPQWNTLSLAHLNNKTHLPAVKYFYWDTNGDGQTDLTIRIPQRFRSYFKVENWQSKPYGNNSNTEPLIELNSGDLFLSTPPYERIINRIFNRCSRVERFVLDNGIRNNIIEIDAFQNGITGLNIDKLVFKWKQQHLSDTMHSILNLIGHAQIKCLVFFKPLLLSADFDAIFPSVSRLLHVVSTVELTSRYFIDDEPSGSMLLWALQLQQNPNPQQLRNWLPNMQGQQAQPLDYQNRVEWVKFKDLLNGTEKVIATLNEETRRNERVRFFITIQAKK